MMENGKDLLESNIDLSRLGITFSSKPIVMGGMAMEYYGIRECGGDLDFIITDKDYRILAQIYPDKQKDKWGDLGVLIGKYELFRSIFRLDYDFFSQGAVEFAQYRMMSLDRLLFMKALAFYNQPEISKHVSDYRLLMDFYITRFQNREYVDNARKYEKQYLKAADGTIFKGRYE